MNHVNLTFMDATAAPMRAASRGAALAPIDNFHTLPRSTIADAHGFVEILDSSKKSAAWSFTNAARIELGEKGTQALGLHVGFIDTDMTKGYDLKKTGPQDVTSHAFSALENGKEEVLVDENTRLIKQSLSTARAYYLNVPALA